MRNKLIWDSFYLHFFMNIKMIKLKNTLNMMRLYPLQLVLQIYATSKIYRQLKVPNTFQLHYIYVVIAFTVRLTWCSSWLKNDTGNILTYNAHSFNIFGNLKHNSRTFVNEYGYIYFFKLDTFCETCFNFAFLKWYSHILDMNMRCMWVKIIIVTRSFLK